LLARQAGLQEYISIQPHYSLVERENFEQHTAPVARQFGLGIIPYSPLGRGFLTGKYRRGQPLPASQRASSVQRLLTDRNFNLLEKLEQLGKVRHATPAQMALAWLLTQDNVSSVIIGANTTEQLADSLGASGLRLSQDEMQALDKLSAHDD
jgi:aryl-alcohol dehydrogenase-like predicted oxidoreductase